MTRLLLILFLTLATGVQMTGAAGAESSCLTEEIIPRLESGFTGHRSPEEETKTAHDILRHLSPDCLKSLAAELESTTNMIRQSRIVVVLGLMGIIQDGTGAVPALTNLVIHLDGRALKPVEITLMNYAQIALARIGTRAAADFLETRAGTNYWQQHQGFWNASVSPQQVQPDFYSRGAALKAIGYMGNDEGRQFLLYQIHSPEYVEGERFYEKEFAEDNVRYRALFSLENIHPRERQFREFLRLSGDLASSLRKP